jgi:geranylgeranyl pyrophosphate synthase
VASPTIRLINGRRYGWGVDTEKELRPYVEAVNRALEEMLPRIPAKEYFRRVARIEGELDVEALRESLARPVWDLLDRGGKRWRPILGILTYEALGGRGEDVVKLMAIPELIHNGTLIVDDVEDGSDYRRGKPCIHKIYGEDIAINAGNTLYYLPIAALLAEHQLPADLEHTLLRIYVEEMVRLSIGQALDIAWHRSFGGVPGEDGYLIMCSLKTGSLARMPVRMACALARADGKVEEALSRFSTSIAVAFQIQDDLLNLVGDEVLYGKEIGGDIREGKRTLMVIHALRRLPREKSERLLRILEMRTSDRALITEGIDLIRESGAIEYSRAVAERMVEESWRGVEQHLREGRAKELLRGLAEYLVSRSR